MLNTSQFSHKSFQKINQQKIVVKKMPTKFRKMIINRANNYERKFCTDVQESSQLNSIQNSIVANSKLQISQASKCDSVLSSRSERSIKVHDLKKSHFISQSVVEDKNKQIRSFIKKMKSSIDKQLTKKRQKPYENIDIHYPIVHNTSRQIKANQKVSNTTDSNKIQIKRAHSCLSEDSNCKNQRYASEQRLNKIEQNIDEIIKNKLLKLVRRQQKANVQHQHKRSKTSSVQYNQKQMQFNDKHLNDSLKKLRPRVSKFKERMDETAEDLLFDISNKDLVRLVNQLIIFRQQDQTSKSEQVIQILDKKIQMIQKILAQNSLQSEAMKKYYFARLSERKSSSAHSNIVKLQTGLHTKLRPPTFIKNTKSFSLQSNTRRSYQAPKISSYDLSRFKHKPFECNVQPLPRSSYNRQYLKFSQLKQKTQSCKKKDHKFLPEKDYYRHKSVYSNDFKPNGKGDIINHKQLDAFRDKFRDLNIYFNPQNNKEAEQINLKQKTLQTIQIKQDLLKNMALKKRENTLIQDLADSRKLQTQNHRQFKGINAEASIIKNKALNKLKYSFRQMTKI